MSTTYKCDRREFIQTELIVPNSVVTGDSNDKATRTLLGQDATELSDFDSKLPENISLDNPIIKKIIDAFLKTYQPVASTEKTDKQYESGLCLIPLRPDMNDNQKKNRYLLLIFKVDNAVLTVYAYNIRIILDNKGAYKDTIPKGFSNGGYRKIYLLDYWDKIHNCNTQTPLGYLTSVWLYHKYITQLQFAALTPRKINNPITRYKVVDAFNGKSIEQQISQSISGTSNSIPKDTMSKGTTPDTTTSDNTLNRTKLEGTTLEGTTLEGTTLEGTTLEGTTLEGTIPEGTTPNRTTSESIMSTNTKTVTTIILPFAHPKIHANNMLSGQIIYHTGKVYTAIREDMQFNTLIQEMKKQQQIKPIYRYCIYEIQGKDKLSFRLVFIIVRPNSVITIRSYKVNINRTSSILDYYITQESLNSILKSIYTDKKTYKTRKQNLKQQLQSMKNSSTYKHSFIRAVQYSVKEFISRLNLPIEGISSNSYSGEDRWIQHLLTMGAKRVDQQKLTDPIGGNQTRRHRKQKQKRTHRHRKY
jgi:hypothetical protein